MYKKRTQKFGKKVSQTPKVHNFKQLNQIKENKNPSFKWLQNIIVSIYQATEKLPSNSPMQRPNGDHSSNKKAIKQNE